MSDGSKTEEEGKDAKEEVTAEDILGMPVPATGKSQNKGSTAEELISTPNCMGVHDGGKQHEGTTNALSKRMKQSHDGAGDPNFKASAKAMQAMREWVACFAPGQSTGKKVAKKWK